MTTPPTIHQCTATRSGDWLVFTCPLCPDFERRLNHQTGEMEFTGETDPDILHEGSYQAPGLEAGGVGLN